VAFKHSRLYSFNEIVPTSLSCSYGGNILACAFTDDKIRILDFRIKPTQKGASTESVILEGEHTDFIKQISLSPDGTVLLSSGQDCVVKVWDLGTRRCIQTIGPELTANQRSASNFHRTSITAMNMNFDDELLFTGGRDGSIFSTNLSGDVDLSEQYSKILEGDNKNMITSL
jgi:WD40 repeat protein